MAIGRDDEIYPNSPLVEVACEIKFAGELQVETLRHVFWERIRNTYPVIAVPNAQPGQAPALQHYRYVSADSTRTVAVALNSLGFSEGKYSGHSKFIGEFTRVARIFSECYPQIDRLNRVGWRYMNIIPFQREEGYVPVRRFLKPRAQLPFDVFTKSRNFDARFETMRDDGVAIVRLAVVNQAALPGVEAILLDFDYAFERQDLRMKFVANEIKDARKRCRAIFEEIISSDYRKYLRGEKK